MLLRRLSANSANGARAFAAVGLCLALGACASPVPRPADAPGARPITPDQAVLNFDSAWSRIANSYYDPDFRGLDWPAVRDELMPRAQAASTLGELRVVIREMLDRIGESHFGLIPGEAADALDPASVSADREGGPGDAGLELRVMDSRLLVFRVAEDGPAAAAGARPGWAVSAIGDAKVGSLFDAAAEVEESIGPRAARAQVVYRARALLAGAPGSTLPVVFLDGADRPVELTLERAPVRGEPVRLGNLPTFFSEIVHSRIEAPDGCVGLIRFSVWVPALNPLFERAMRELRDCRGIVLDLRGNAGGVGGMVMGVSGYYLDEIVALGTMRTRQGEIRFVSNPRRSTSTGEPWRPYAGPVAILVDEFTASTSEIFAAGMQQVGRARLFGETTAGQALPALMVRLPNRDVLYHAIAELTAPDGTRLEGHGAVPDLEVPLARDDLLDGRDASLEAALHWIRESNPHQP